MISDSDIIIIQYDTITNPTVEMDLSGLSSETEREDEEMHSTVLTVGNSK